MPDHHLDHQAQLHGADSGLSGQFGTLSHVSIDLARAFVTAVPASLKVASHLPQLTRSVSEQDCLKAIAAEQKRERDKTFWGAWAK